jgi:putative hydrolase of the HAD superfamily
VIRGVIFDCFGVLYPDAVGAFCNRYPEVPAEVYEHLDRELDLGQIALEQYCSRLGELTDESSRQIFQELRSGWRVDSQLVSLLTALHGRYKLALLSNAGAEEIDVVYKDGVAALFDVITVSHEIGVMKPDRKIFEICLADLAVQPHEAILIDDNPGNLEVAKRLGILTIPYERFGDIPPALRSLV